MLIQLDVIDNHMLNFSRHRAPQASGLLFERAQPPKQRLRHMGRKLRASGSQATASGAGSSDHKGTCSAHLPLRSPGQLLGPLEVMCIRATPGVLMGVDFGLFVEACDVQERLHLVQAKHSQFRVAPTSTEVQEG